MITCYNILKDLANKFTSLLSWKDRRTLFLKYGFNCQTVPLASRVG